MPGCWLTFQISTEKGTWKITWCKSLMLSRSLLPILNPLHIFKILESVWIEWLFFPSLSFFKCICKCFLVNYKWKNIYLAIQSLYIIWPLFVKNALYCHCVKNEVALLYLLTLYTSIFSFRILYILLFGLDVSKEMLTSTFIWRDYRQVHLDFNE